MAYGTGYGGAVGPVPAYPPPHPPPLPTGPWGPVPGGLAFPVAAPQPRRSSAAVASLVLGLVGVLTAPLLGGVVPGVLAVVLASSARREIAGAQGWLTGSRQLAAGRVLGWTAVWVAAAVAVALMVQWLLGFGDAAVHASYPADVE